MRRLALWFVLIASTVGTNGGAAADFIVCNRSSVPKINVAFGYYHEAKGWTTIGWLVIDDGECKAPVRGPLIYPSYYLYGFADLSKFGASGHTEWSAGDGAQGVIFCVGQQQFFLHMSDFLSPANSLDCEAHGYVSKKFIHIDVGNSRDYTYNLLRNDVVVQTGGTTAKRIVFRGANFNGDASRASASEWLVQWVENDNSTRHSLFFSVISLTDSELVLHNSDTDDYFKADFSARKMFLRQGTSWVPHSDIVTVE